MADSSNWANLLPAGIEIGMTWVSHDNGKTWTCYPRAELPWRGGRHMSVVGIDVKTGTVTMDVSDG